MKETWPAAAVVGLVVGIIGGLGAVVTLTPPESFV